MFYSIFIVPRRSYSKVGIKHQNFFKIKFFFYFGIVNDHVVYKCVSKSKEDAMAFAKFLEANLVFVEDLIYG